MILATDLLRPARLHINTAVAGDRIELDWSGAQWTAGGGALFMGVSHSCRGLRAGGGDWASYTCLFLALSSPKPPFS